MTPTIPARDWELTCHECDGSGHVYVKHQVAERTSDVQEFKEECECCEGRGFVFAFQDIPGIEEYVKACRTDPAAGDALDARQLIALADAVVVQWQREDKMPQMAWGFREFLVAGMQAFIDSNRTPHGGDSLVDALARLAYYYAVELESATRNADSDRLEEIARSITAKLKGEIRAAIAAQRKGDA
ncbi:hypothetical protein [Achromobacter xylosoxidans]|uniref:hypothetical protein n=1 Tax=Alcaligenes xylosoxydans xylosoxydans TaxID=85698 RepID=UPI001F146CB3|nr:hypothetical protein [Achromobacter xylosoxidans]